MNCLIVDDNELARTAIRKLASQVDDLEILAECDDAIKATNFIKNKQVDLILLDIEMPDMTGLELTKNLGKKSPLIIFTTAKKDYAVEAFEMNVVDYLIKPISPARFMQAIDRAREAFESARQEVKVDKQEFVFIRDNGILKKLNIDDILYLEAMGDYVKVYTSQKFHIVHATLKSLEEKLPSSRFMRVHRSYIIALNKIEFIQDGSINIAKSAVPIADAYRSSLNQRLNLL